MIALIDYNVGNLASIINAFKKVGSDITLVSNPEELKNYDKAILPGVGAYGDAMEHLKDRGMDEAIKEYAKSGNYMIGICLGMQLLFQESEEFGQNSGLGLIDGSIKYFDVDRVGDRKIPHMGWNEMRCSDDAIFAGLNPKNYLYFVHSLHAVTDEKNIIGKTTYGYEFCAAVRKDNIYGFQPHPEKSHDIGLKIVKNFIDL